MITWCGNKYQNSKYQIMNVFQSFTKFFQLFKFVYKLVLNRETPAYFSGISNLGDDLDIDIAGVRHRNDQREEGG